MGIEISSQFDVKTTLPLDSRTVVADITARNAIPAGVRYISMEVKVLDSGDGTMKKYWLVGGITNSNWEEFSSGGGGGRTVVTHADVADGGTITGLTEPGDYSIYVKGSGGPITLDSDNPIDIDALDDGNRITVFCTSNDNTISYLEGMIIGAERTLALGENATFEKIGTALYSVQS